MKIRRLLAEPSVGDLVAFAGGDLDAGPVLQIAVLERLGDIGRVGANSLCVCTAAASAEADTYRIDVALRSAGGRVPGIVLKREEPNLGPSATILAERGGVGILTVPPQTDLGQVIHALTRLLSDRLDRSLESTAALIRHVDALGEGHSPDFVGWAAAATAILGVDVAAVREIPSDFDGISAVAFTGSDPAVAFTAPRQVPMQDILTDLALRALAHNASVRLAGRYSEVVDERTLASMLAEIVLSDEPPDELLARAEQHGFRLDAAHIVVRFHVDGPTTIRSGELAAFDDRVRRGIGRVFAGRDLAQWNLISLAETITYSWNGADEDAPTAAALRRMAATVDGVLGSELGAEVYCGIGGTHLGVAGLRASAAEARAALSHARQTGKASVALYDALGLRRMLLDWTTGDATRRAFDRLLGPLESLSSARRNKLLDTVVAMFEHEGNSTAVARALDVHRNTVDQRIAEAYDRVDLDQADADHRLMLYLAARARRV